MCLLDLLCDSWCSPQGDVLAQAPFVFAAPQTESQAGDESSNRSGIQDGNRLQDDVHLPVVDAHVLLHERPESVGITSRGSSQFQGEPLIFTFKRLEISQRVLTAVN